jgi:hypothetical protein
VKEWLLTEDQMRETTGNLWVVSPCEPNLCEAQARRMYIYMMEPCAQHAWRSSKVPARHLCSRCMQLLRQELGIKA